MEEEEEKNWYREGSKVGRIKLGKESITVAETYSREKKRMDVMEKGKDLNAWMRELKGSECDEEEEKYFRVML